MDINKTDGSFNVDIGTMVLAVEMNPTAIERALTTCLLLGLEPVNTHRDGYWFIPGGKMYVNERTGVQKFKYGMWLKPHRAAIAYCLREGIDIQT